MGRRFLRRLDREIDPAQHEHAAVDGAVEHPVGRGHPGGGERVDEGLVVVPPRIEPAVIR